MRAILLVLILAIVALIVAVASGLVSLNLTRSAQVPQVSATGNGVTAKGGQAPAFDIETGSVKVGTKQTTVNVPTLDVQRAGQGQQQPATDANAAAPADNVAGM